MSGVRLHILQPYISDPNLTFIRIWVDATVLGPRPALYWYNLKCNGLSLFQSVELDSIQCDTLGEIYVNINNLKWFLEENLCILVSYIWKIIRYSR